MFDKIALGYSESVELQESYSSEAVKFLYRTEDGGSGVNVGEFHVVRSTMAGGPYRRPHQDSAWFIW
jgi:hypothetical protein